MSPFDVLVVGGGPAGSSAAWHCAMAGLEVCIVDRAQFPRAKPCAEYVSPEGSRILHAMGALDTLEQTAAQLTGMVVHAPSGGRIHGEFVARHGFRGFRDRGLGIRREVLDTILLGRARAAGAQVIESQRVDALTFDRAGTVNGVRTNGRTIQAKLVIGADGLRSIVARRLGVARSSRFVKRVALVAHYRHVDGVGTLGEMHVTRNGYVGLARVNDTVDRDLVNVALVVPRRAAAAMRGDSAAFLDAWLGAHPQLAPRFASATRVTPVRATGPFASRAKRPWAPGAMLTGDAADFFDPFTGEGIYSALRGGELLAPFALDAVRAPSRTAHIRALRGYQHARAQQFGGKWRVEQLIGLAVGVPALLDHASRVLSRDRDLADLLIGVTGDFVPPSAVLRPRTLLRLLGLVPRSRMT